MAFVPGRGACGGRMAGNEGEQGDKDDDEAGDEGGFDGGGAGEAGGLKLVAGGEEDADEDAGADGLGGESAERAAMDEQEGDACDDHAEEIEEEGRGVGESGLDEDEGAAPDGDDAEQEEGGEAALVGLALGAHSGSALECAAAGLMREVGEAWKTVSPLTTVRRTRVWRRVCGDAAVRSWSRTTRSARKPGSRRPFWCSRNSANAEAWV